jgi:hypothetical protein
MIRKKWIPVFPRDKRGTRLRGDHAQIKEVERHDDSKKRHAAPDIRISLGLPAFSAKLFGVSSPDKSDRT